MKDNGYNLASEEFLSIANMLPPIFSGRYDLEFMEQFREHMDKLASKAYSGDDVVVHSVMDELCLYMASETASDMIHDGVSSWTDDVLEDDDAEMIDEWYGEVCGDEAIKMLWDKKLYNYISRSENPYCFDNWNDDVFNMSKANETNFRQLTTKKESRYMRLFSFFYSSLSVLSI